MVTLAMALEDMRFQLIEAIQGAITTGFELVAGVVGDKLAKSAQLAVKKNAEVVGSLKAGGGGGFEEIAGLREQIKDNATILLPLLNARNRFPTPTSHATNNNNHNSARSPFIPDTDHPATSIRIVTTGSKNDGIRALVVEVSAASGKPHMHMWSHKHASPVTALKDLLGVTQASLKIYTNQLMDPPTPVVKQEATFSFNATTAQPQTQTQPRTHTPWTRATMPMSMFATAYPSFNDMSSPIDSTAADVGNASFASNSFATTSCSKKPTTAKTTTHLFWDADMITNPSFGGFDYGSFSSDSTVEDDMAFDSDDATRVDPVGGSFW